MSLGYDLFDHDSTGILELQKDDELAMYTSDDAAWLYFISHVSYGKADAIGMAIQLLRNWRPYMEKVMRGEKV